MANTSSPTTSRVAVAHGDRRQTIPLDLEQDEVSSRVIVDNRDIIVRIPVGQYHHGTGRVVHDVETADNNSGSVNDHAGTKPCRRVDRDNGGRGDSIDIARPE